MAWLDGWSYRVPVAVVNSGPAATVDVSIPIPGDWDLFWTTIDTSGNELRLCSADGFTVLTYQIAGASPSWSKANRTGRLEIDGLTADNAAASVILVWLYFGNSGASSAAGSFVAASAVDGYIHNARPVGWVCVHRPHEPGTTRPVARVQKTVGERIYIWHDLTALLERRRDDAGDSDLWEEVWQVVSLITNGSSGQAAMIEQAATRFLEIMDGGRRRFFVGMIAKAGTTGTNYTIEPVIDTYVPELTISSGLLVAGEYRTIEPRALLTVEDVDEA